MPNRPTTKHSDVIHRILPARRGENPFQKAPLPIPAIGYDLRASDLFRERSLEAHLHRNAEWLQARPRTSEAIEAALFPHYSLDGVEPEDVRTLLNHALWDAGYAPSRASSDNPTWTWVEGH